MATTTKLTVTAKSDTGKRRRENQDSVLAQMLREDDGVVTYILAVSDGVGGGPAGKLASEQALSALSESLTANTLAEPASALDVAVQAANARVFSLAAADDRLIGMAATLTAALVRNGEVWLANVGDSRGYLIQGNKVTQLTRDHSWVAEEVAAGRMTPDQARNSTRRNVITRAIGAEPELTPDLLAPFSLGDADTLLLCSDGLHGMLRDEELAALCATGHLEDAAERLIALANERGGPDNISVVLARRLPEP